PPSILQRADAPQATGGGDPSLPCTFPRRQGMGRMKTLAPEASGPAAPAPASAPPQPPLRESVSRAVQHYLSQVDAEQISDLYDMVLAEVEIPLLEAVMQNTRSNQTRASQMLGLNRGTLRKKLKDRKSVV